MLLGWGSGGVENIKTLAHGEEQGKMEKKLGAGNLEGPPNSP